MPPVWSETLPGEATRASVALSWRAVFVAAQLSAAGCTAMAPAADAVVGGGAPASRTPRDAATLCTAAEVTVFSCNLQRNGKTVSLCSSEQLKEEEGYLQYRFGRLGKIELVFPANRVRSTSAFRYERYTRPLVTYLTLSFANHGHRYVIYQNANEEERPPVREAGVTVTPPGGAADSRSPLEMPCREPVRGSLMTLEGVVPEGDGGDTGP